jgi:hypothetical protein
VLLRTSDSIRVFPISLNLSFVFLSKKKPLIRLYSMHPRCFKAWLPLRALQGSDQLIMFAGGGWCYSRSSCRWVTPSTGVREEMYGPVRMCALWTPCFKMDIR